MKSHVFTLLFFLVACLSVSAQEPGPVCTFNYQAVVRDADDKTLPDRNIAVRLSVLDGPGGNALYIEEHHAMTSSLGLFSLEVGAGIQVGGSLAWEAIPWIIRKHFLKVEVDINNGQSYEVLGEAPILAVPIAIQAKFAALAYQTIDTITKVLKTLCADTLKAKIACLDTVKSDKIMAKDLCVDTIKINVNGEPRTFVQPDPVYDGDILVDFDRIEGTVTADTIELTKLEATDVCAQEIALVNSTLGDAYPVLSVDNLREETILDVDRIRGVVIADTMQFEKVIAEDICTEQVKLALSSGEKNLVLYENPEQPGSTVLDVNTVFSDYVESNVVNTAGLAADNILAQRASIDTLDLKKLRTEDICAEYFTLVFQDGETQTVIQENADGRSELGVGILMADSAGINKLFAGDICSEFYTVLYGDGEPRTFLREDDIGRLTLQVDKIDALDVCTDDLTIFKPNGEPLLEINPSANMGNDYGFIFNHNIMVNGGVMANFKQFVIDHPLDPENKNLHHFSIESDKMLNIYNGTVILNDNGEAWVGLPDWFEALNTEFSYQLTCIGGYAQVYIANEIAGNKFRIAGGQKDMKVSWQVSGIRHDKQARELQMPIEQFKKVTTGRDQ